MFQSQDTACHLGEVAARRCVAKFRDSGKAAAAYCSSISDKTSMGKVSEREREVTIEKYISNSVSKPLHLLTKEIQQRHGPKARTNRLAVVGQSI